VKNVWYKIVDSDLFRLVTLTVLAIVVTLWTPVDWLVSKIKEARKWK
jgi:hypothetical protein